MDVDSSADADHAAVPFEGDFFGTQYEGSDLPGWADEDAKGDQEEEEEDDNDNDNDEDEKDEDSNSEMSSGAADEDSDDETELVERMEALRPMWEPEPEGPQRSHLLTEGSNAQPVSTAAEVPGDVSGNPEECAVQPDGNAAAADVPAFADGL